MYPLLDEVIEAHGGLERWNKVESIAADVSIGGALWDLVGMSTTFENTKVVSLTRSQRIELDPKDSSCTLVFDSGTVQLRDRSGEAAESFPDARRTFAERASAPAWNEVQAAYFNGYALWQYLNAPFLYTYPGFEISEDESWEEEGETWRVLRVCFPDSIVAHTRVQYAYFGPDRLLRRLRYTVDVLGDARGVNYAYDYETVNGIAIPLTRSVYAYGPDLKKIPDPVLVSIRLSKPKFLLAGQANLR